MAQDEGQSTIINVKGVSAKAWETTKKRANLRCETMGEWLTRAINTQANLEAGPREFPPANPATPSANPPPPTVDLREVASVLAACGAAGVPLQKRVAGRVNALLFAALPPARQISGRKESPSDGLASLGIKTIDVPR